MEKRKARLRGPKINKRGRGESMGIKRGETCIRIKRTRNGEREGGLKMNGREEGGEMIR